MNQYHVDNLRYSLNVLIEYHHDKQYSITININNEFISSMLTYIHTCKWNDRISFGLFQARVELLSDQSALIKTLIGVESVS